MELKDLVTSLKLSKKLKEKGFFQSGMFYWNKCFTFAGVKNPTKKVIKERHLIKTYKYKKEGTWLVPYWECKKTSNNHIFFKGLIGTGLFSSEKNRKKNMKKYKAERKRAISFRAVTSEELLKELIKNQICFELVWHDQKALIRKIWGYRCPVIEEPFESNNFANTLALIWIYLVNKKLLKGE